MDYSLSAFSFHISWGVGRSTLCNASFSCPPPSPLCFKIWRCTYGPLNSIRIFHHILKCCFLKMTGKTQILNLGFNADAQQKSVIFKVTWFSEISNLSLNKAYYEESSSDTATTFSIIHANIGIAWSLQMYRNIHLYICVYISCMYTFHCQLEHIYETTPLAFTDSFLKTLNSVRVHWRKSNNSCLHLEMKPLRTLRSSSDSRLLFLRKLCLLFFFLLIKFIHLSVSI